MERRLQSSPRTLCEPLDDGTVAELQAAAVADVDEAYVEAANAQTV